MVLEVREMPLAALVHLVNGWGTVPRHAAADRDVASVAQLVDMLGEIVVGVTAADLADAGLADAGLADADLERVADQLFPVFAASSAADRAGRLTALLTRSGVRPAVSSDGERSQPSWLVSDQRSALLAAAVVSLRAQRGDHGSDRLGTCGADHCADVYVDASPAGHRRFCSVTCQNRARVAVFRSRRRSEAKN